MSNKFKNVFTNLGLVTDDSPVPKAAPTPVVPTPQTVSTQSAFQAFSSIGRTQPADPDTVTKLKSLVLGSSPIIGQFIQNIEVARSQFPNDEMARLKAALAFTKVAKSDLIEELNRTVAASLVHAKKSTESERSSARASSVGDLDKQCATITADINTAKGHIVELQQAIADKQSILGGLQQKIQNIETDLQRQDGVINASFAEVEIFINLLGKTFTTL